MDLCTAPALIKVDSHDDAVFSFSIDNAPCGLNIRIYPGYADLCSHKLQVHHGSMNVDTVTHLTIWLDPPGRNFFTEMKSAAPEDRSQIASDLVHRFNRCFRAEPLSFQRGTLAQTKKLLNLIGSVHGINHLRILSRTPADQPRFETRDKLQEAHDDLALLIAWCDPQGHQSLDGRDNTIRVVPRQIAVMARPATSAHARIAAASQLASWADKARELLGM